MTTAIISFPVATGGNHLRNIISVGTDFTTKNPYAQSMLDQYTNNNIKFVHSQDVVESGYNFTSAKLQKSLMNPAENCVLHGHFAEIMSHRDDIKRLIDKKFILISFETHRCREIWIKRSKKLKKDIGDSQYFIGEQVFLYEAFMYYDLFKVNPANVMNIGISEWFASDILGVLQRIENFLDCRADLDLCMKLHEVWWSKNQTML